MVPATAYGVHCSGDPSDGVSMERLPQRPRGIFPTAPTLLPRIINENISFE
jgi:hypothetical protein